MDLSGFSVPVIVYDNNEIIIDQNSLALQITNGISFKGKPLSVLLNTLSYTHTSRVIMAYDNYLVLELIPMQRSKDISRVTQIEHELSTPILQLQTILDKMNLPQAEVSTLKPIFTTFKKKLQSITLEMIFRSGEIDLNTTPICAPFASAKCDENKILYALLQLINNAVKMTPSERAPKIILSLIDDKQHVCIRVTDNGVGFNAADPYRLTEAYVQGDDLLNKPNRGLGVGLYLVRKIVELHGGTLGIRNNTDIGATIEITLPKEEEGSTILNSPRLTNGIEEIKERVSFLLVDVQIEKRDE